MSSFATIEPGRPLRLIQVGAGGMGKAWLRTIKANPDVELVGLVDLDLELAEAAAKDHGFDSLAIGRTVTEVASNSRPDAVINVTVPVAHHAVSTESLFLGLPVLSEKPAAPTVAEALSIAASAEAAGQLLMVSQSRRYYRNLVAYKAAIGQLGDVAVLTNQFFKGVHFPGFRETMDFPLLIDMAIHPFDVARYLLDADPVSVYADSFNPPWSWFAGDAAASVTFEFAGGARFLYSGSWVANGVETSWNGDWRASTAAGTALWDGEGVPRIASNTENESAHEFAAGPEIPEEIAGSLAEFVRVLRSGEEPSGEIHSNVHSLAMVEAAVLSATTGQRVLIADVLDAAREKAIAGERRADVKQVLVS
jgi:predicted dehydrogenase